MAKPAKQAKKSKGEEEPKKPSFMAGFLGFVVATILAGGAGAGFALKILPPGIVLGKAGGDGGHDAHDGHDKKPDGKGELEKVKIRPLSPVTVNILQPKETWIRLESAVILENEDVKDLNILLAKISEDVAAYMKTVTVAQLEGATALQNLKEDLTDRARIRSEGKVKEVVINGLVAE